MDSFATDLMESNEGEPFIAIDALSGTPEVPTLVLHSQTEGVFYRTGQQIIEVQNIAPEMYEKMREEPKVLIAEIDADGLSNAYYADVKTLN